MVSQAIGISLRNRYKTTNCQFVQIEHGHSPFDPKNEWVKNMFNWDIYSNPMDVEYNRANILSQKKEHGKK